jgi:hypothetical protein
MPSVNLASNIPSSDWSATLLTVAGLLFAVVIAVKVVPVVLRVVVPAVVDTVVPAVVRILH